MNKVNVAICTHSEAPKIFVVGEAYELNNRHTSKGYIVDGKWIGYAYDESQPDIIDVRGTRGVIASFNKGEARSEGKSMMKMLVRAFVLVAKSRGWGDSKNGANKSWNGTPYKNTKDWARCIAGSYDLKEVEQSMFEDDPKLKFIDQEAVNFYAENEIDNW